MWTYGAMGTCRYGRDVWCYGDVTYGDGCVTYGAIGMWYRFANIEPDELTDEDMDQQAVSVEEWLLRAGTSFVLRGGTARKFAVLCRWPCASLYCV